MTCLSVENFMYLLKTNSLEFGFQKEVVFLRKQVIQLHPTSVSFLLSLSLCVVTYYRICSHKFTEEKEQPSTPQPPFPFASNVREQLVEFIAVSRHCLRSIRGVRLIILILKREDPACAFVLFLPESELASTVLGKQAALFGP